MQQKCTVRCVAVAREREREKEREENGVKKTKRGAWVCGSLSV